MRKPIEEKVLGVAALARSAVAVAAVLASGCAWKIYQGPETGQSAEAMRVVAAAIDGVLAQIDLGPCRGEQVYVDVQALAPALADRPSTGTGYVRAQLVERLVGEGCGLVDDPSQATVMLSVMVRAAGVDVIRRDFPPLYHHTTFRGLADARVVVYRMEDGRLREVLRSLWAEQETYYREIYLFYIIGPITSAGGGTLDAPLPEAAPAAAPGGN